MTVPSSYSIAQASPPTESVTGVPPSFETATSIETRVRSEGLKKTRPTCCPASAALEAPWRNSSPRDEQRLEPLLREPLRRQKVPHRISLRRFEEAVDLLRGQDERRKKPKHVGQIASPDEEAALEKRRAHGPGRLVERDAQEESLAPHLADPGQARRAPASTAANPRRTFPRSPSSRMTRAVASAAAQARGPPPNVVP